LKISYNLYLSHVSEQSWRAARTTKIPTFRMSLLVEQKE